MAGWGRRSGTPHETGETDAFRGGRLLSADPNARLELASESGDHRSVELPLEHDRAQGITPGSHVYAAPRDFKAFTGP